MVRQLVAEAEVRRRAIRLTLGYDWLVLCNCRRQVGL